MASPYILSNMDLQYANCTSQDFSVYLAFLNPVSITTTWNDLNLDNQGNWQAPPNTDTAQQHIQPYAPTANLGPNRIGFVGEPLYFDGSRSSQRHDIPVVSYSWSVSGGASITTYSNRSQCAITWPAPGLYIVSLTVTDVAGTTTTGSRQVTIYQDRQSALPGVISVSGLSGSISSGGWQCQLTTVNSQVTLFPPDALPVGTYQPVVLLIETRYEVLPGYWVNRTIGPYGTFAPGQLYCDPRIFFDGYVQSGTIHQDVEKDTLSFSCIGPQMVLQESKTHMLGYYNTTIATRKNQQPATLNTSANGKGFLVDGLMVADVVHSLLQYHTNIGSFHDIHCWNANIPTKPYIPGDSGTAFYEMTYTNLSVNEGTVWSNIQDLTSNEWSEVFCERDGSIRVGPQINYRGNEYWLMPTLLGPTVARTLINFVDDLGAATIAGGDLDSITDSLPETLPATPMPVRLVHPWGHHDLLPVTSVPFEQRPSPDIVATQQALLGPPFLCVFSDTPSPDTGNAPPQGVPLFPWVANAWPQDLAVYPISFDIPQNYTGRTSLVKLIGTLANANNVWSSWYPQNAFQVAGDGTSTIITSNLPAGNWMVDERRVIPDVTSRTNKQLVSNYWWEMARRLYYAQNVMYQCQVTLGMFTPALLGDIVGVTRQQNTLGPHWSQKPFFIQEINYQIDLTNKTWSTSISTVEVTSALLGPIQPPPKVIPKY